MESSSPRRAPGPRGLPFFGSTFEAWRNPLDLMTRTVREHGHIVSFRFGPHRYVLLNQPDAVHHVLVTNAKNYTKSRNYQGLKLVLGEGLLTSEGDHWRRQRKLAQPAFHRERLAGFVDAMARDTSALLERWDALGEGPVDVHTEMMRLTFRIVGRTLFSTDVEADADAIGRALSHVLVFANDYVESLVPLPTWVPTPRNLAFKRQMRRLDALVQKIIDERRARGDLGDDLLSMLMTARDETTNEAMSDQQLRDEVMTIVLAGHETTANALAWTWYLLSRHPDVARRLHQETRDVLGERAPTLADLPRLELTKRVVEESMRLYPPAWCFERQAVEPDEVMGFAIPRRGIVGISPYMLHRHEAYWENPEGFDPDRFLPERSAARPRYTYLPFGGGARMCIGNAFATMEAQIVVAMIARRRRLELVAGHPIELDPRVTLRPRHGVKMWLRPHGPARRAATESAPIAWQPSSAAAR
jgi:cytochrome P450